MAFARKVYRKKRPTYRKRIYRKKFSRTAPRRRDNVVYTKLSQYATAATNGSGILTGYLSCHDPSAATNWANYAAMYDEYRVCAVKIRYIPWMDNAQITTTPAGTDANVFLIHDNDSTGAALSGTTIATMLGYNNCKVHRLLRQWKYYARIPKTNTTTSGKPAGWLDTSAPGVTTNVVYYTSDASVNTSMTTGHLIYTFYCKFMGKK